METRDDDWPAWGRLIDDARDKLRPTVSQNEAARRAGITGTHWRQIVKGEAGPMTSTRGVRRLALVAQVAKVTPEQLEAVGRSDVAKELRTLMQPATEPTALDKLEALVKSDPEAARAIAELIEIVRRRNDPAEPEAKPDDERGREAG